MYFILQLKDKLFLMENVLAIKRNYTKLNFSISTYLFNSDYYNFHVHFILTNANGMLSKHFLSHLLINVKLKYKNINPPYIL